MNTRVIEAPGMGPIWLSGADYGRIRRLAERLNMSETEVIQTALRSIDDALTVKRIDPEVISDEGMQR